MATTSAGRVRTALTITPTKDGTGARLSGEIDLATAEVLAKALDELVHRGGDVHLDLADLRFVDVSGVAVVVAAAAELDSGRTVVLHHPPPALSQILNRFWPDVAHLRVDPS